MRKSRFERSLIPQYWFKDSKGHECYGIENYPVFVIKPEDRMFSIYYYDACLIHRSNTVEDAKAYIISKLGGVA